MAVEGGRACGQGPRLTMSNKGRYNRHAARRSERRFEETSRRLLEGEPFAVPADAEQPVGRDYVFPLGDSGVELHAYAHSEVRGMVVKFHVALTGPNPMNDEMMTFYSIDSAEGVIHYHRYVQGVKQPKTVLERIPAGDWNFVDAWYQRAVDMCCDIWEDEYNGWSDTFRSKR